MHAADFDVVIVGAGLVGASLARALGGAGLRLALVERSQPVQPDPAQWDTRVYAISPASEGFLRRLAAWPAEENRLAAVTQMLIYGDRARSRLRFSAYDAHVAKLATIVESSRLAQELYRALEGQPDFTLYSPARCAGLEVDTDRAMLRLGGGETLHAKLLVAADGADSWVRARGGMAAHETAYGQSAVVANFGAAKPHHGTAFQWFRPDGVLALLPLPGERASMVWSARQDVADRLMSLSPDELCAEVGSASGDALGTLTLLSPAASFPLRLIRVPRLVAPRLALVGDAAHNLHPLAGQGVNLGFQDARELAAVLAARGLERDAGSWHLLRRYERARREDILAMTAATHGLQRLFNNSAAPLAWLRNLGLDITDRLAPLKALLVRHALG
jgi:2-polyprenylphenol 6-hydroxylase